MAAQAGPDNTGGPAGVAVATHGLVRDYGHGAGLHGIDLTVRRTEVYGLIGPNGAGKTTLLSILAGLRRADAGRVQINFPAGRVAMCPDAPEFESWLTAGEVVRQSRGLACRAVHPGRASRPGRAATAPAASDATLRAIRLRTSWTWWASLMPPASESADSPAA